MTEFFQTAMGRQYYERTVPRLVEELGRLNERLDSLLELVDDLRDLELKRLEREGRG